MYWSVLCLNPNLVVLLLFLSHTFTQTHTHKHTQILKGSNYYRVLICRGANFKHKNVYLSEIIITDITLDDINPNLHPNLITCHVLSCSSTPCTDRQTHSSGCVIIYRFNAAPDIASICSSLIFLWLYDICPRRGRRAFWDMGYLVLPGQKRNLFSLIYLSNGCSSWERERKNALPFIAGGERIQTIALPYCHQSTSVWVHYVLIW